MSAGASLPRVLLQPFRERPLLGRHPWVFSGAVRGVEGAPADGDAVDVVSASGGFVARGLYNSRSQIRVRLYGWDPDVPLDASLFRGRLAEAVAVRSAMGLLDGTRSACRVVFSEGDGLSGLVVDRYADRLSLQFTSLALARRQGVILDELERLLEPRSIHLRTEKGILEEEGLELSDGLLRGEEPPGPVSVEEAGLTYLVDLATGQKTGFFLDQRENRARAAAFAAGRGVADVFCYTGGFTLQLLRAGARSVVAVDVSRPALELARRNLEGNDLSGRAVELVHADAFEWLESRAREGETFDMLVVDPPRFARSQRGVARALRGYVGLNELAVRCLAPGGILVTCSCTGRVSREAFVSVLAAVEARTGRRLRILESGGQAPDHPVSPSCPETEYLKCLICRAD